MAPPKRLNIFNNPSLDMGVADDVIGHEDEDLSSPSVIVIPPEPTVSRKDVEEAMPAHLKLAVTDSLVEKINNIASDPLVADTIRENFVSYTHVLKEGKFKVDNYLDAAAYVSYKMMGFSNQDAYARTFPARIMRLRAEGRSDKEISSYVSAFNKNKLVNLIWEQTLIAPWVLNQDLFQKALYVQGDLMINADSEKVRTDAANSILNALKRPEVSKITLDVDIQDNSGIDELKGMLTKVAENQQKQIEQGISTKTIAHEDIYKNAEDAEIVD